MPVDAIRVMSSEHTENVHDIEVRVRAGRYRVDTVAVADALLRRARVRRVVAAPLIRRDARSPEGPPQTPRD